MSFWVRKSKSRLKMNSYSSRSRSNLFLRLVFVAFDSIDEILTC
ncbi:Uncharacterised protein [Vibrio cholerae]|nr:Uncharacterised protein [Vibrio cholerae]